MRVAVLGHPAAAVPHTVDSYLYGHILGAQDGKKEELVNTPLPRQVAQSGTWRRASPFAGTMPSASSRRSLAEQPYPRLVRAVGGSWHGGK